MGQILPTSIAVRAHVGIGPLHGELARLLKERHRVSMHVFCTVPEDVRAFDRLGGDGRFESIAAEAVMHRLAGDADDNLTEEDVLPRARRWEERLGCSLNRLIMTNRHLGRSRREPPAVGCGPRGRRDARDAHRNTFSRFPELSLNDVSTNVKLEECRKGGLSVPDDMFDELVDSIKICEYRPTMKCQHGSSSHDTLR